MRRRAPDAFAGSRRPDGRPGPADLDGRRVLVALGVLAGLPAASQTMLVPVLPELEQQLGRGPAESAWLLTAFLVSASVAAPVLGRLGDLRGRRRLLMATAAAYTAGSLVCWTGHDRLDLLVLGRLLQGVAAGAYVLSLATVNEVLAPRRRPYGIGVLAAVVGVGPVLGFVLGGVAARIGGADLLLALASVAGAATFCAAWAWVPPSGGRALGRLDLAGVVTLALTLVALLVLVSRLAVARSLEDLVGLTAVTLVCGSLWLCVERRARTPLVDLTLVLGPAHVRLHAAAAASGAAMLALLVVVTRMVQEPVAGVVESRLDPLGAVLVLLPGASLIALLTPAAVIWGARVGHHHLVRVGGVVAASGFAVIVAADGSLLLVGAGTAVAAAGLGLTVGTLPALVLDASPAARVGEASGANSLSRGVGSAVGAQLSGVVLATGSVAGSFDRALVVGVFLALVTTVAVGEGRVGG